MAMIWFLTHCGPVTQFDIRDLDHLSLGNGLPLVWHENIDLINSVSPSDAIW